MKPDSHQLPDNAIGATSSQPPSDTPERVAELIHRVAQKDRRSFALLYRATAPKLLGTVLRILRDREWADDVIQDSYLKVWQKAEQFQDGKSSPITWLVSIARNSAIDELRKHPAGRTTNSNELDEMPGRQSTAQEQLEDQQAANKLNHCIDQLEKDRQDMVRLAYLNGWSREDLASQFEQPVNTVKTWLHRALKQIKRCLES
ncbi:RNA polymerase subunit sigma-24 [Marinobacter maroccanus]|uniref:RNA polymerase sigma factor n=1 Tax=Marinobacter maroccanus TaxID=2055143 RepID=A0A2S5Z9B4_9GAMM|nr:sigma-70 family RNA polymerase sigma factor [Marinobacter maroccanus]PPI83812.1 RNA polymerase subunit sigma-24 [Marinobacter maroccanus]